MPDPTSVLARAAEGPRLAIRSRTPRGITTVVSESPWPLNPNGAIHGGVLTAAMIRTAMLTGPEGGTGPPLSSSVSFLRPALPPLTLEAVVRAETPAGRLVTVTALRGDGKVCGTGQVNVSADVAASVPEPISSWPEPETAPLILPPDDPSPAGVQAWAESLPVSRAIGLRCTAAQTDRMTLEVQTPGGPDAVAADEMVAAWADHCFGIVAFPAVRPGSVPATAGLTVQHLGVGRGNLTLEAVARKAGRTVAFVDVDVHDASGALVAVASGLMSVDGSSHPTVASDGDRGADPDADPGGTNA